MKKEKGIQFSSEMVKAILEGSKTQTRRIIKPQPTACTFKLYHKCGSEEFTYDAIAENLYCQSCGHPQYYERQLKKGTVKKEYRSSYQTGDILYVKETWRYCDDLRGICYKASPHEADNCRKFASVCEHTPKWKLPMFMPKEAARIFLRVIDVKIEQLQDISINDCIKEGIPEVHGMRSELQNWYEELWDSIYAKREGGIYAWERNPWVWVYTFERMESEVKNDEQDKNRMV